MIKLVHSRSCADGAGTSRSQNGIFEGYASLFGVADTSGDVIHPSAFSASLQKRGAHKIRMLFQHDPAQPVGTWLDIRQDRTGLFVRGRLNRDVQRARELAGLLRDGAIDGLSIGFRTLLASRDRATGLRHIRKVDLWEISLVTFPMLAGARVTVIKAAPQLLPPTPDGPSAIARERLSGRAARLRQAARHLNHATPQGVM